MDLDTDTQTVDSWTGERRGLEISSVTTSARACDLHCCQQ